jgi:hypothetical protein
VFKWGAGGELLWEAVLFPSPIFPPVSSQLPSAARRVGGGTWSEGVDAALTSSGAAPALLVLANNALQRLALTSGDAVWSASDLAGGSTTTTFGAVTEVNGHVLAVGVDGGTMVVATRRADTGAAVGDTRRIEVVTADGGIIDVCRLVNGGRHAVCLSAGSLYSVDLAAESAAVHKVALPAGSHAFAPHHSSVASRESAAVTVLLSAGGGAATFRVGAGGLTPTDTLPEPLVPCGATAFGEVDVAVAAGHSNGTLDVVLADAEKGGSIAGVGDPLSIPHDEKHGRVRGHHA